MVCDLNPKIRLIWYHRKSLDLVDTSRCPKLSKYRHTDILWYCYIYFKKYKMHLGLKMESSAPRWGKYNICDCLAWSHLIFLNSWPSWYLTYLSISSSFEMTGHAPCQTVSLWMLVLFPMTSFSMLADGDNTSNKFHNF